MLSVLGLGADDSVPFGGKAGMLQELEEIDAHKHSRFLRIASPATLKGLCELLIEDCSRATLRLI